MFSEEVLSLSSIRAFMELGKNRKQMNLWKSSSLNLTLKITAAL